MPQANQTALRADPTKSYSFVIGDPQGNVDLLRTMLEKVRDPKVGLPLAKNDKIVVLGNFLHPDRNMFFMMNFLKNEKFDNPDQLVLLRGRVEQGLISFKKKYVSSPIGMKLLATYRRDFTTNYTLTEPKKSVMDVEVLRQDLKWLAKNTIHFVDTPKFFICTAGTLTNHPIERQPLGVVTSAGHHMTNPKFEAEKTIVHGTVSAGLKPRISSTRICVNTSPHTTNSLSCVVMNNNTGECEDTLIVSVPK